MLTRQGDPPSSGADDRLGAATLTGRLASRLRAEIESGRWAVGAQLPTESRLVQTFGVSRTVVREAVAALRQAGLVTTRQGRGAFVSSASPRGGFEIAAEELSSLEDVLLVLELRTALEVEAAALAAARRTPEQEAAIAVALQGFAAAVDAGGDAIDADFRFHLAIAEATGNLYFGRLLRSLGSTLIPRQRVRAGLADPAERHAYLANVLGEHKAIARAVHRGEATAARRAMARHLAGTRYRMLLERTRPAAAPLSQ